MTFTRKLFIQFGFILCVLPSHLIVKNIINYVVFSKPPEENRQRMEEVCNNGIDDDGDGLIDVFDSDCQCLKIGENLVPNGDFESFDPDCCTQSIEGEDICVDSWSHKAGTPDFVNRPCFWRTDEALAPIFGVPLDNNFFGVIVAYPINDLGLPDSIEVDFSPWSETIGTCLNQSLKTGRTYSISFDVALKPNQDSELVEDAFFLVNGISKCDSLSYYRTDSSFCELPLEYENLGRINLLDLEAGWNTFQSEVTLTKDLEAVFLSMDCSFKNQSTIYEVVFFDNLEIKEKQASLPVSFEISSVGNICRDNLNFIVSPITRASFQWYQDSILIEGADKPILPFDSTMDVNSQFHISIEPEGGNCQLIGPFQIEMPIPQDFIFFLEATICEGVAYPFGDTLLTETGNYEYATIAENGCDSMVTLELLVLKEIVGDTMQIEQEIGKDYFFNGELFTEAGLYNFTFTAKSGCDSTIWLDLSFFDPCAGFEVLAEWAESDCEEAANGWIELMVEQAIPSVNYSIDDGQTFQTQSRFENLTAGIYSIIVMDTNSNCTTSTEVILQDGFNNLSLSLPDDTTLFVGQSIHLKPSLNLEAWVLEWQSEAVIPCSGCSTLRLNPTISAYYYLMATDRNGCTLRDSIYIDVLPKPQLFIPNVFSPNGDGINDVLKIEGQATYLANVETFSIYNRWGDLVYQTTGGATNRELLWDGTIKNQLATSGVYLYWVKWKNEENNIEILHGSITLIR